jgi:hypothetical protein
MLWSHYYKCLAQRSREHLFSDSDWIRFPSWLNGVVNVPIIGLECYSHQLLPSLTTSCIFSTFTWQRATRMLKMPNQIVDTWSVQFKGLCIPKFERKVDENSVNLRDSATFTQCTEHKRASKSFVQNCNVLLWHNANSQKWTLQYIGHNCISG